MNDLFASVLSTHYTIKRELGGGGMSRVFLAEEKALGRKVVIKVLPGEMTGHLSVERFRREISLAAQLQHPHIVPLLAAGEVNGLPYFTMPYVRGESLRDRLAHHGELPVADAVRILREVATALAHAHAEGVVHRDIKPENILLSGDVACVTDFGVAKALSDSAQSHSTLTSLGVALGTPAYMSPEQATANPIVDQRSDIYAWGILAYEVLTGSAPFAGRSLQAQLAAHVTEEPEVVSRRRTAIPAALADLVMHCLAKRPADRPQRAIDLVHALDALVTPSAGTAPTAKTVRAVSARRFVPFIAAGLTAMIAGVTWAVRGVPDADARTIAVMPFANIGGDTANAYFSEGMADELISALGHLPGLRVAGRASSFSARLKEANPRDIGRALSVGAYVSGSIQRSSGRIRVAAQLVSTRDGISLWSETFERPLTDVFQVQDEIARAIAAELQITLTPAPVSNSASSRGTSNPEAYQLFRQGRQLWARRGHQNISSAIDHFKRALVLDPSFARAHAGLALAHVILPGYIQGLLDKQDSIIGLAEIHANRALQSAPDDPDARVALAFVKAFQWRWNEAEADFRRVLQWDPSNVTARIWFGMTLTAQDRVEEAIEQLQEAVTLDPLSQVAAWNLAVAQLVGQRFEDAHTTNIRMLQIDTMSGRAHTNYAMTSVFSGRYDEALRHGERGYSLFGAVRPELTYKAIVHAHKGEVDSARRALAALRATPDRFVGSLDVLLVEALLGNSDTVFAILDDAARRRAHGLIDNLAVCHPSAARLWSDPRFPILTRRMGIPMCTPTGAPRRTR